MRFLFQRHSLGAPAKLVLAFILFTLSYFSLSLILPFPNALDPYLDIQFNNIPQQMDNFYSPLMEQDSTGIGDINFSQYYEEDHSSSAKRSRNAELNLYNIPTKYLLRECDLRDLDSRTYLSATNPFSNIAPDNSIRSFRTPANPDMLYLTSLPVSELTSRYKIPLDQLFIISNPTANDLLATVSTHTVWQQLSSEPISSLASSSTAPKISPTALFKTPGPHPGFSSLSDSHSQTKSSVDKQFFLPLGSEKNPIYSQSRLPGLLRKWCLISNYHHNMHLAVQSIANGFLYPTFVLTMKMPQSQTFCIYVMQ
jgi:hypothetical protein